MSVLYCLFAISFVVGVVAETNCPKALTKTPSYIKSGVSNAGVASFFKAVVSNQCLKGARIQVGTSGLGTLNVYEYSTQKLLSTTNATFLSGTNNTIPFNSMTLSTNAYYVLELVGERRVGEAYLMGMSFPIKSTPNYTYEIVSCKYTTTNGAFPVQPCTSNTLAYIDPVVCDCDAACSTNNDCVSCTSNSCEWCLASSSCINSGGSCSSFVSAPKFCPVSACSAYSSCNSCTQTKNKCAWCLGADECVNMSSDCSDHIGENKFCPTNEKKKIEIL